MLKNRTDRSYEALAKRSGVSSSSLHRYCAGTKIPSDYGAVQRFAAVCGASPDEQRQLHRLWAVADASRHAQPAPEPAPEPEPTPPPAAEPHRHRVLVLAGMVVVLLVTAGVLLASTSGTPTRPSASGPLLLSSACPPVISMGQHDECAREVQRLLSDAGAKLSVDGDFGPQTLRRVTAFQVLAGLQARGVVDEATKRALYDGKVKMATWSPEQVERRVREVFTEEPNRAVGIARCQSFLDPLHVLPNTNGTRNWGVFQLSDSLLKEFDGTPRQAYDPEWNIKLAHEVWSRNHDFSAWPHCDQPFRTSTAAPAPSGQVNVHSGR